MKVTTSEPVEVVPVADEPALRRSAAPPPTLDEEYADFFNAHWASSYRLAGLMGADDPENVAQEALARLHLRFGRLRGSHEAERYLRATVCNLSRSTWRRRGVAERALPRLAGDHATDPTEGVAAADALLEALRKLSARQREVIVLRYWLDLSEHEIAETLGISTGSVKTHASRGMAVLREEVTS